MSASAVGPSTPQFQLLLSLAPSRFCSPLSSLCFSLYETRSFSEKPSWQVTKFTLASASRCLWPYTSGLPTSLSAIGVTVLSSPLKKRSEERRVGKECRTRWCPVSTNKEEGNDEHS